MRWDFWNNPLVVSAFRVKYRSGGPWLGTVVWMLVLAGVAYLFQSQFADRARFMPNTDPDEWLRVFVAVLFGGQAALSAALAFGAVQGSMQNEVYTRTLEFQRIAGVSPAGILQGKLLGETFSAFALLGGSVPFVLFAVGKGVLPFDAAVLLYVNVATTIVLAGSLGLLHSLIAVPGKTAGGANHMWIAMLFVAIPVFSVLGNLLRTGGYMGRAIASAAAPAPQIVAVGRGLGAWEPTLSFFQWEIPCLLATPIFQLLLASLPLLLMARRLRNPLDTGFTKVGYLVRLAALDALLAAFLHPIFRTAGPDAPEALASFWIPHLAFVFAGAWATPNAGLVQDWVWRRHGESAGPLEWLFGARAPTLLWAPLAAAVGVAMYLALAVGLHCWEGKLPLTEALTPTLCGRLLAFFAASWAFLAFAQATLLLGTGPGIAAFFAMAALGIWTGATGIGGWRYGSLGLFSLSLAAPLGGAMEGSFTKAGGGMIEAPAWPAAATHLLFAAAASALAPRFVAGTRKIVLGKLRRMGALPEANYERNASAPAGA